MVSGLRHMSSKRHHSAMHVVAPIPQVSREPTPSDDVEQGLSSIFSNWQGRTSQMGRWLKTSPMTSSFIEDEFKGTAKTTRRNTLQNRAHVHRHQHIRAYQKCDRPSDSCSSISSVSSSSSSSRSITFTKQNRVYYSEDNSGSGPKYESIKAETSLPPLEVRRYRSRNYNVDPSKPCFSISGC